MVSESRTDPEEDGQDHARKRQNHPPRNHAVEGNADIICDLVEIAEPVRALLVVIVFAHGVIVQQAGTR